MAANDPGPSKKKDADIQTQIICGVKKDAPESPTKDTETQTQFTYDPKLSNSEIIAEIQTQDPVHSADNIDVAEPEAEAELEAEDEAQEEELGVSDLTPDAVPEDYPEGGEDEGNNDFMTEEVDAAEMEAETEESSLPDEESVEAVSTWEEDSPDVAPTEEEPAPTEEEPAPIEEDADLIQEDVAAVEEENTAEIVVQTDMVLGISTVGITQPPVQCQSEGIQTVFTYDLDHSVTKIERELQRTHPRHPLFKEKLDADSTVRDEGPASDDVEVSPGEEVDDEDDDVLLADNQRIGKTQTDLILGVDSTSGLAGRCYSAGIQTVITYDTDHSNTEVRQELRRTHPRHSIEEVTPNGTEVEEESPPLFSKSMDMQTVFTFDVNNSESNSRIERELQRNHPRHSIAADNVETDEVVDVVPEEDTSPEIEPISDVPVATDENYQEDVEAKDENTAEIEVQTSMMFGVDSKVNIPLNRQSAGIQTVFTYDGNLSITDVKEKLRKTHPRHSMDNEAYVEEVDIGGEVAETAPTEKDVEAETTSIEDEEDKDVPTTNDEKKEGIEVQTSMILGVDSTGELRLEALSKDVQTDLTYNSVPRKSMDVQTMFTYDVDNSDTQIQEELKRKHPRHSTDERLQDVALETEVEVGEPPSADEEAVETVSTWEEDPPELTDTEEAAVEADPTDEEVTPIEEDKRSPEDEEDGDVLTSTEEKTVEIEVQTSMMLGVDSTGELRLEALSKDVQTDLTYNSVPRKSMDVQTMFTYDVDNSDTQIQEELKRKHPRHSTDERLQDVALETEVEVGEPPSADEEAVETVSTWEEDPPELTDTEEAAVEADPTEEEVTPIEEDEKSPEDEEGGDVPTSTEEKTVEIEVQTSMMLGVDSAGELPAKYRSTGVQTDLTYNSVPRKSMDVQTMFTYDMNNSDTQIQEELKRKHPRHNTDAQQNDESNDDDVEPDDVAPEGSVSSGEGELETRFIDATHSKAEDWLPEAADIDVIADEEVILGDEEELVVTVDESIEESQSNTENSASQSPIRESSDDELIDVENDNVLESPLESVTDVHSPMNETVDSDTTDLPKTIKLKLQIVVGEDREPMNMDIAIAVRPLSRDNYPTGGQVRSEDTLFGIPKEYLKQVISTIIDAVIKELPDGTELSDKRDVEAQTNMALGRDSTDKDVDSIDTLLPVQPELRDEENEEAEMFTPSTDQFEMVPMLETDLLVPQDKIPTQYISTLVPLNDDNCESVEDLRGKWRKNRRFSDKLLLDSSARRVSSALNPKKSPTLLVMQDVDYEHWGFPHALNTRYESVVSVIDSSQLDEADDSSSIGDEAVRSRFIFQMKKMSEETLLFDNIKSIVKDKMSFQTRTKEGEDSNGQKNKIKLVLQYGRHPTNPTDDDPENKENPGIDEEKASSDEDDSLFVAIVELEESESGEITSLVHYSAGNTAQTRPIIFGESPFELSIPIRRDRMLGRVSETEDNNSKPETFRLIRIVVIQDGDDSNRESIALLDTGAPVTINIPVGDGTMGITVTANIVIGGIPIGEEEPVVKPIPPKPIRCTVITNGVPGETFEQIMEERSDAAEPIFFFLPMAEGMVRARLLIVPRTEPLNPPPTRASHLPKGTAVSCQVVHSGILGTELTKSLQPGGLPLHMDIPQNLGLTAKILIPHDGDRLSDGDYCRDRAFEMVADALSTYEQGIQPMQNLLDEICEKIKRLPVLEMAGLGEPADQPYVDLVDSDIFSESDCSVLKHRGNSPRSSNTRCQPQQRARHSQCNCGSISSRRFVPAQSSPQHQNCNERLDQSPLGRPACSCGGQRSGSSAQPTSPLAQMYITLSQPWICGLPANDRTGSRSSSHGSRLPSNAESDSSGPSYDQCGVRERRMYSGGCADSSDLPAMSGRRRETRHQPRCGAGSSTRRSINTTPDPRGGIRGRCQRCGSSAVDMSLPPPPPPSCGCDAIVPLETALIPLSPPGGDDSNYLNEPAYRGCRC